MHESGESGNFVQVQFGCHQQFLYTLDSHPVDLGGGGSSEVFAADEFETSDLVYVVPEPSRFVLLLGAAIVGLLGFGRQRC